jgi:serine/threonine-protein kinase
MGPQNNKTRHWQLATELIDPWIELPLAEALRHLKATKGVSAPVRYCAERLLQALHKSRTILQESENTHLARRLQSLMHLEGRTLAGYRLERLLSPGGLSSVYLAHAIDRDTKTKVAAKVISPLVDTRAARDLFDCEKLALGQLRHRNIVRLLDGQPLANGCFLLVTEYLPGARPLDSLSCAGYSLEERVKLLLKVADALAYAHSRGVIHNDVKASNVLVGKGNRLKLIDFGISLLARRSLQQWVGAYTPNVAAPEHLLRKPVTEQTDIFMFGALMLKTLTGETPLPEYSLETYDPADDEAHVAAVLAHARLPEILEKIIRRAMSADSRARYASMRAVQTDLNRFLHGD